MKSSKIWLTPKNELEEIVKKAITLSDILREFGLSTNGASNHHRLKQRLKLDNIDYSHIALGLRNHKGKRGQYARYSLESILVENSTYTARSQLKKRLVAKGLLEYKCSVCSLKEWLGKPISLQLDHINGQFDDNRIENLRLICPNCHSQSLTYAGKNKKNKPVKKAKIYETNDERQKRLEKMRKFNPSKEELEQLVHQFPMTTIGKKFGVSDNAVRKRCKLFGIQFAKAHWDSLC